MFLHYFNSQNKSFEIGYNQAYIHGFRVPTNEYGKYKYRLVIKLPFVHTLFTLG